MSHVPAKLAAALQDRYRLERELGQGGMATVYLAQDLRHGRRVAVKVLHPELSAVLGGDRFITEIHTTAALQHPHILPLFDSGEAGGLLFYVMPFIEGENLRTRLGREKQLPVADAIRLTREVAGALDYAHRQGVIHRDIKPENILLHDGRALVADFGIALAVQSAGGQRMTQTGLSLGTPQYMSPEQAMGERDITARSDIYSLGVVAYEMLTGDPPFTGSTTQSIVARVLTEEPRPIGPQRRSVPEEVEAAILTALEKLPADRFGSAAEFATALAGEAPVTRRATAARAAARGAPRRTALVPGLAAALVVAAALATWGWIRPASSGAPPTIRDEVDLPTGGEVGYGSRIALSPDGSRLVFQGPAPGGGEQLWLRSRDRIEAVPIAGTEGAVHPFFSPDGTRLAFMLNSPSVLKVMKLDGGLPVELARDVGLAGASWGSDGYLYVDGLGSRVIRVPEAGGATSEIAVSDTAGGETEITMPHALPNGRGVIVTIHRTEDPEGWTVGVVDSRSGEHRSLVPGIAGYFVRGRLLVVSATGELSAAPFDLGSLSLRGEPQILARGIHRVRPWGVDLGVGDDAIAYGSGAAVRDSLLPGWIGMGMNAKFQPIDEEWVGGIFDAILSPDGSSVAFTRVNGEQQEVWVRRLDNGALTRLSVGTRPAMVPTWSRDSRTVYYTQTQEQGFALVSRPADAGAGETRHTRAVSYLGGATSSLDGSQLVYSEFNSSSFADLMLLAHGDTQSTPLLRTATWEGYPSISPNGRWLLFTSNEGGVQHVYVRPFPNVTETVWQVSTESGDKPRWSNDGREIFYQGQDSLRAVEVVPGPTFALGRRRTLLSLSPYDPDRRTWGERKDGRFLVLKRVSSPPNLKIVVVQNLSTELGPVPR